MRLTLLKHRLIWNNVNTNLYSYLLYANRFLFIDSNKIRYYLIYIAPKHWPIFQKVF